MDQSPGPTAQYALAGTGPARYQLPRNAAPSAGASQSANQPIYGAVGAAPVSETRRPPPPPPPPPPPVPVDVLSNAQLSAIYAGEQLTGVIINVNGKNRRVRLNESIDGWVLRSVQGRVVTFDYGGQQRQLQLMRAKVGTSAGGKPLSGAPAPSEAMTPAPAAVPAAPEPTALPPSAVPQEAASSTPARRPRFGP